ncbi:MAG TPA: primase-helicase family protein [bacterium]|jgi:energy-coupling factor transporter ATP-binding protein EcfA2
MGINHSAAVLPLQIAQDSHVSNTQDINFDFTLSVSPLQIFTKADGRFVVYFESKTFNSADTDALNELFTTHCYSANSWYGTCASEHYAGMTGVVLDIDGGLAIEEAKIRFQEYNYILHTSTSHQAKEPLSDRFRVFLPFAASVPRFTSETEHQKVYWKVLKENPEADSACGDAGRKFFPHSEELGSPFVVHVNNTGKYFDVDISDVPDSVLKPKRMDCLPSGELGTKEELARVIKFCPFIQWCIANAAKGLPEPLWYAMISNLCRFEGGRDLIHHISSQDPIPGRYDFDDTEDKIQKALVSSNPIGYETIVGWEWPGKAPERPYSPAGWGKLGQVRGRKGLGEDGEVPVTYDDHLIVNLDGHWQVTNLEAVKNDLLARQREIRAVCPFCDCDDAVFSENVYCFAKLECPKCQKTYFEHPLAPNIFSYKNQVMRIEQRYGKFSSMEMLKEDNFRNDAAYCFVHKVLVNSRNRRFLDDNFQIRKMGSGDFEKLSYEFRIEENAVQYHYPALPPKIQDNAFIDAFLDRMFGLYSGFIKDWMALYSYTNYIGLPVIVLTGPRGCGKGTFAQMMAAIFPSLAGLWDGDSNHFNENYTSKLLFVDENPNADKASQYTEIKKITGNKTIMINGKYKPEYYVPNNIKIIIATNDPRPMFLKAREEPKSENNNNFFIFECPDVDPSQLNNQLGQQLEDRLGYYVRTALKARYQRLAVSFSTNARYTLPTPITNFAKELFCSAKTLIETEADELARYIVLGIDMKDPYNPSGPVITLDRTPNGTEWYVQQKDIRRLIERLRFKGNSNPKAYINELQNMGVISHKDDYRNSLERLGYRILRDKSHYDNEQDNTNEEPKSNASLDPADSD